MDSGFEGGLGSGEVSFNVWVVGGADKLGLSSDLQGHAREVIVPPPFWGVEGVLVGRDMTHVYMPKYFQVPAPSNAHISSHLVPKT